MPSFQLVIYFLIYCQLPEGIQSVKEEDYVEAFKPVMIDDTNYSMVELPGSETKLVVDERRKLLNHIDLRTFVKDDVEWCIQTAYHGMEEAGPEYVNLKIEVQELGYHVTRLCHKSAYTVSKFKTESTTILTDLQAMYGYLLDGFEGMALKTLSSLSDVAGQMARAAEELHNSFDEEVRIIKQLLEKTQVTEADEKLTAKQRKKERISLGKKIELEKQQETEAQEKRKAADLKYHQSEREENEAIEKFNDKKTGFVEFLYELALSLTDGKGIGQGLKSRESHYKALKEKKEHDREIKMLREEEEKQASHAVTELFFQLQHYESKVSSAKALHTAIKGLQTLRVTMMQAAFFWENMHEYCNTISNTKLKDKIAKEMREHNDKQQLKSWISMPFKKQLISFNAGWVALDDVCGKYIEVTQKDPNEDIKEDPTLEELKADNNPTLVAQFQKDVQDACAKGDSECK